MLGSVPLLPGARIPMGIRLMATPLLGQVLGRTMKPGRRMLMHLMSSMGEAETILRYPDLLDSLVDAAHDPVAMAANVAEFQALLSPLGPRTAVRIRPDDLRRVAVRTLMIWGDRDPVVSVADARAAAELIPRARLEVLSAGHVPSSATRHGWPSCLRNSPAPEPRMSESTDRVLIAGGGIAGLATAAALGRQGIASVVLERRDQALDAGLGINLPGNA